MLRRSALLLLFPLLCAPLQAAPADTQLQAYARGLRNPDGGYRAGGPQGPSTLSATLACVRTMKYSGGSLDGVDATAAFVRKCQDATGGYADTPGGQVEVRLTALGLMAEADLNVRKGQQTELARDYLDGHAMSLPDIYMAAAAADSAKIFTTKKRSWIEAFEGTRKGEGVYGSGPYETAGAVISILRLGGTVADREAAGKAIRGAQRQDGGFAAADASDLGTTYRMMRALRMLEVKPDLERLRAFVKSCRNADGGYGPSPGKPSGAGPSYYASIVLHWAEELAGR